MNEMSFGEEQCEDELGDERVNLEYERSVGS